MNRIYDAIVIGGGIVGMSTAYHLVCGGASTLLIDRKDTGRATDAGAGILSPATNTRDPDPWLRLASLAVKYYPGLIQNLRAEQDGETGFATCGMMIVAVSDDELPTLCHCPSTHLQPPYPPRRTRCRGPLRNLIRRSPQPLPRPGRRPGRHLLPRGRPR